MLFGGGFGPGGQGGFGPGGPGGMQIDPTLVENLFGPGGFPGGFPMGAQGGQPEAPDANARAPPTAKSTLRTLPRIKVSKHDIEKNESNECSICLDELVLGEDALRIPCGHLYHEDCVNDWLKKSNECPVCRWELPTDDSSYEQGRKERMKGRKIRLRHEDLANKSCAELRRLALFLNIDSKGCLEKSEFVECIAASDQVQIVEGQEEGDVSSSSPSLFDYASASSGSGMARAPPPETAAEDAMQVDSDTREKRSRSDCNDAPAEPPPTAVPAGPPLSGQSVGQLRKLAVQLGVSLDGCLEKSEIVQRIRSVPGYADA